jgi:hypothetical protein
MVLLRIVGTGSAKRQCKRPALIGTLPFNPRERNERHYSNPALITLRVSPNVLALRRNPDARR